VTIMKIAFLWRGGKRNMLLQMACLSHYYTVQVLLDTFEEPCFVVEDKHGLHEEMGSDTRKMMNGVTLVKPRDAAWPNEFL